MGLKALLQKVKTPILTNANANGIEFSTINGPQNKKSKIGIVGGGVSGVHMAYSLKKMGFEDVTILEKSNHLLRVIQFSLVPISKTVIDPIAKGHCRGHG